MPERTVAIVGRPNVGKSALFNRLIGRRVSIVHDMPGVTRDRIVAECKLADAPFNLIDTGGIGADADPQFSKQVRVEVDLAVETSEVLLFVVDGHDGLTPLDIELARQLRKAAKPLIVVVNKIDHPNHAATAQEFLKLGFPKLAQVSAEHDRGIGDLVSEIDAMLPPPLEIEPPDDTQPMKIAIVGRPNVGKSSLTNAILRDERTLVSAISGTTRDAIDIPYERGNKSYILIDTAGIRPRGKVSTSVEAFSVMRSENSITRADLCCLVIDASMGVTAQDKKIAGLIQEAKKPCLVAVNKWDLVRDRTGTKEKLNEFMAELRAELFFIQYAPLILVSASEKIEITRLFKAVEKVRGSARERIGTGVLNRLLADATSAHPAGVRSGRRFKVLYATQPVPPPGAVLPVPKLVFFCNDGRLVAESYLRYLDGQIRLAVPWPGLPLLIQLRSRPTKQKKD